MTTYDDTRASGGEFCEFQEATRADVREAIADEAAPTRRPGADVDVRAIRAGLGLSQPAFAAAFGLKLAVLRDWEQGRTKPEGATRVLLMTIAHRPEAVRQAVEIYGSAAA